VQPLGFQVQPLGFRDRLGSKNNRLGFKSNRLGFQSNRLDSKNNRFGFKCNRLDFKCNRLDSKNNRLGFKCNRLVFKCNRLGFKCLLRYSSAQLSAAEGAPHLSEAQSEPAKRQNQAGRRLQMVRRFGSEGFGVLLLAPVKGGTQVAKNAALKKLRVAGPLVDENVTKLFGGYGFSNAR